ncbi:MAG: serine/threonine protein kinase [Bacteroidetes bacterium]|nr:serine/threonine protein kinase [Bacteroidota bacterium]
MLTPNTVIQNYRLVRKLGEGGMGEVWLAEHLTIARKVAIKVLHAQYARNPKIQQRFRNEAATLSKLKHPNIVALYDFIESDSDIYLVMEYVEGRNLEEVVRTDTGPMPTAKLLQIFKQILSAVGYAHQQGVVHRDIKPSNFMIGDDGVVKVLDFGIAKLLEDDQHLTKTGLRMGTTFYMSPEQVNTEAVDHRSDIYSLGVTLFFLATGKAPYEGETSEYKVFDQIVRTPLPAGRTVYVGVAPEVDAVIAKATKKAPADRFQGCGEFWEGFAAPAKPVLPKEQLPSAANRYPNWKRISALAFLLGFIVVAVVLVSKNVKGTEPNNASIAREKAIEDSLFNDSLLRATVERDNQDVVAESKVPENEVPLEEQSDIDGDGIEDLNDACPKEKGSQGEQWLPKTSRDHDGISDSQDLCPDRFGNQLHRGCPDTDGDGVYDDHDQCITLIGTKTNYGCPLNDSDNDGLPDTSDRCPYAKGTKANFGCPDGYSVVEGDIDGDGVTDRLDKCPNEKGTKTNDGCPDQPQFENEDSDGDGVSNRMDKCPTAKGLMANSGCPEGYRTIDSDQDGDGVANLLDKCPNAKGTKKNHGCPDGYRID